MYFHIFKLYLYKVLIYKTYRLKLNSQNLTETKRQQLFMLFKEAKYYYNFILAAEDAFKFDTKINEIEVNNPLTKEKVKYELKYL